jgi:hypothetical protein
MKHPDLLNNFPLQHKPKFFKLKVSQTLTIKLKVTPPQLILLPTLLKKTYNLYLYLRRYLTMECNLIKLSQNILKKMRVCVQILNQLQYISNSDPIKPDPEGHIKYSYNPLRYSCIRDIPVPYPGKCLVRPIYRSHVAHRVRLFVK